MQQANSGLGPYTHTPKPQRAHTRTHTICGVSAAAAVGRAQHSPPAGAPDLGLPVLSRALNDSMPHTNQQYSAASKQHHPSPLTGTIAAAQGSGFVSTPNPKTRPAFATAAKGIHVRRTLDIAAMTSTVQAPSPNPMKAQP